MRTVVLFLIIVGIAFVMAGRNMSQVATQAENFYNSEVIPKIKTFIQKKNKFDVKVRTDEVSVSAERVEVENKRSPETPIEKYNYYLRCLESEIPCPEILATSNRGYVNHVIARMSEEMEKELADMQMDLSRRSPIDEELAQTLAQDQFHDVQMVGVKMLYLFPPSEKNFDLILSVLKTTTEPDLLEESINPIESFQSMKSYNDKVVDGLMTQIRLGLREETSLVAARKLLKFIHPENVRKIDELANELQPHPRRFEAIRKTLAEYTLNQL